MRSAIGTTVFKTVEPMGAGLWSKKAHWRRSVPDTSANGRNPSFSNSHPTGRWIKQKQLKNGLKWSMRRCLLPRTDDAPNGHTDLSQSSPEDRTPKAQLSLYNEVKVKSKFYFYHFDIFMAFLTQIGF